MSTLQPVCMKTHLTWTVQFRAHRKLQSEYLSAFAHILSQTQLCFLPLLSQYTHTHAQPTFLKYFSDLKKGLHQMKEKDISKSAQQPHWAQNKHNGFFNYCFLLMSNSKGLILLTGLLMWLTAKKSTVCKSKVQVSSMSKRKAIVEL